MAGAVSKRKRFKRANELRRYKQTAKWNTVAFPKAPVIKDLSAPGGGVVKILVDKYSGFNKGTGAPTVEQSPDGVGTWTAVTLSGYQPTHDVLTGTGVVAGVKFIRLKFNNTFGSGVVSNVKSITVT